jgi:hypothetical protein
MQPMPWGTSPEEYGSFKSRNRHLQSSQCNTTISESIHRRDGPTTPNPGYRRRTSAGPLKPRPDPGPALTHPEREPTSLTGTADR